MQVGGTGAAQQDLPVCGVCVCVCVCVYVCAFMQQKSCADVSEE